MFKFPPIEIFCSDGYSGKVQNVRFSGGFAVVDVLLIDPAKNMVLVRDISISIDMVRAALGFGGPNESKSTIKGMLQPVFDTFVGVLDIAKEKRQ